ncbi:hypothetical protein [Alishewanella sp. SMS8]|uniref:hypothetical protein n=1 Tax=Alishewanella sp. SMS8 TaxID=2994676 RepID=UPI002741DB90|nr:hypothetical protein [Alishewanella sp. SMS8]MDP5459599.1 hypothetical protein [Alishewanella sp. SMS8]
MKSVLINGPKGFGKLNILARNCKSIFSTTPSDFNKSYIIMDSYESMIKLNELIDNKRELDFQLMTVRNFFKSEFRSNSKYEKKYFITENIAKTLYEECQREACKHDTFNKDIHELLKIMDENETLKPADVYDELKSTKNTYFLHSKISPVFEKVIPEVLNPIRDLSLAFKIAAIYIGIKFKEKKETLSLVDYNDVLVDIIKSKDKKIKNLIIYNFQDFSQLELYALKACCFETCNTQFYGDKWHGENQHARNYRILIRLWSVEDSHDVTCKKNSSIAKLIDFLINNRLDVFSENKSEFYSETQKELKLNITEIHSFSNSLFDIIKKSLADSKTVGIAFDSRSKADSAYYILKNQGIRAVNHFQRSKDVGTQIIESVLLFPIMDFDWNYIYSIYEVLSQRCYYNLDTKSKINFSISLSDSVKKNEKITCDRFDLSLGKLAVIKLITDSIITDFKKLESVESFLDEVSKLVSSIIETYNLTESEFEFDLENFKCSLLDYLASSESGLKYSIDKFCKKYFFEINPSHAVQIMHYSKMFKSRFDTVIATFSPFKTGYYINAYQAAKEGYWPDDYYEIDHSPPTPIDNVPGIFQRIYNLANSSKESLVFINLGYKRISYSFLDVPFK